MDYNNDGSLDLFVATIWETAFNQLYHNNGDGTFSIVTNNKVVNEASRSVSGAWGDYDNDGWIDLFVANLDGQNNSLYRNLGNGNFEKITSGNIVNDGGYSVGGSWGDYNNDGFLDLFVANASEEENFLYKNNGNGTFTKETTGAIVTDLGHTHGSAWADFDNDGDLDLFAANDGEENLIYANNSDGTFTKRAGIFLAINDLSFGSAYADFDLDGDLDLFVANREGTTNALYENNKWNCNNWVGVKLVNRNAGSSVIGAKVTIQAQINGQQVVQMREVSSQTGGGTGGQNDLTVHFGLGDAIKIDQVNVKWPSGYEQSLSNQSVNQHLSIKEETGSEVTGFVYFKEGLECSENGNVAIPPEAQNATYRTIKNGDWDSSSTWRGGNKPSGEIEDESISIEHDLTLEDDDLKFKDDAKLWITNGSLTLEKGKLEMEKGNITMQNAVLEILDEILELKKGTSLNAKNSIIYVGKELISYGSLGVDNVSLTIDENLITKKNCTYKGATIRIGKKLVHENEGLILENVDLKVLDGVMEIKGDGSLETKNSMIEVSKDFKGIGPVTMENICMAVGEGFITENNFTIKNAIARIGKGFEHKVGDFYGENAKFSLDDGDFKNDSDKFEGNGLIIWVKKENLKNDGNWSATVTQYCVAKDVDGISSNYLPNAEVCANVAEYFSDCGMCGAQAGQFGYGQSDDNNNKIGIPNAKVVLQPGGYSVYTDENGYYSASVPEGNYMIEVIPGNNYEAKCPNETGTRQVTVSGVGAKYSGNDFGNTVVCSFPDMKVELAMTAHRIGFENLMVINYENIGATTGTDPVLSLTLDDKLTPIDASIDWEGKSTTLVWNLDDLDPGEQGAIYFTYQVNTNTAVGQQIDISANLTCANGDCNVVNDNFALSENAVGAVDPNDILVSPEGGILTNQVLSYKIRFQNVWEYSSRFCED